MNKTYALLPMLLLVPSFVFAAQTTQDNFNNSQLGVLTGQNKGSHWTAPWVGSDLFMVENTVAGEGSKAVRVINTISGPSPRISRSFSPKTSGTLHFMMGKDGGNQAPNLVLYSGSDYAMIISIGSDAQQGLDWIVRDGGTEIHIQPYTVGSLGSVDVQFNSTNDSYRVSINSGTYTGWLNYITPVSNIDRIELLSDNSGDTPVNVYWDDIRFDDYKSECEDKKEDK
jgi:hypothetical protein